jgi:hypothetical protein
MKHLSPVEDREFIKLTGMSTGKIYSISGFVTSFLPQLIDAIKLTIRCSLCTDLSSSPRI